MKEKKARVEDALHATRAAVEEGIVPGGGVALVRCIPSVAATKTANEDQDAGVRIVQRALEMPLRLIVENAGVESSVVCNEVKSNKGNYGYNAATGKYGDMVKGGVLDPTKVARSALQNAASIAGLLLTTEASVVELPKKNQQCRRCLPVAVWTCKFYRCPQKPAPKARAFALIWTMSAMCFLYSSILLGSAGFVFYRCSPAST